jgi:hypothetical protein
VCIDIAGFTDAHNRMKQQLGVGVLCGPQGQLLMGAMHRIARPERNDPLPATTSELGPQVRRRAP